MLWCVLKSRRNQAVRVMPRECKMQERKSWIGRSKQRSNGIRAQNNSSNYSGERSNSLGFDFMICEVGSVVRKRVVRWKDKLCAKKQQ